MFTAFRKIQLVSLALLQLVNQVCATPYLVDSNKKCRNSSTEYLHEPLNLCCSKCPPGYRLSKKCTATSDTECKKCQEGTFSSKMSFANCFLCLKCKKDSGLQYAQNCTATSNAKCVCQEGWFCTLEEDDSCKACSRRTSCPVGFGVSKKGTPSSDVTCEPCKEGTFSDQQSYTQACRILTDCHSQGRETLFRGNTTSDAKCGPVTRFQLTTLTTVPPTTYNIPAQSIGFYTTFNELRVPTAPSLMGSYTWSAISVVAVVLLVAMIIITVLVYKKKGKRNNADTDINKKFLPENGDTQDASSSSASSQTESTHGVWVGPVGTGRPDPVQTESPKVNVSVTTTINYSLCPSTQLCSAVTPTGVPTVFASGSSFPLSKEEVLLSQQCEEGKEVRVAVQESGKDIC